MVHVLGGQLPMWQPPCIGLAGGASAAAAEEAAGQGDHVGSWGTLGPQAHLLVPPWVRERVTQLLPRGGCRSQLLQADHLSQLLLLLGRAVGPRARGGLREPPGSKCRRGEYALPMALRPDMGALSPAQALQLLLLQHKLLQRRRCGEAPAVDGGPPQVQRGRQVRVVGRQHGTPTSRRSGPGSQRNLLLLLVSHALLCYVDGLQGLQGRGGPGFCWKCAPEAAVRMAGSAAPPLPPNPGQTLTLLVDCAAAQVQPAWLSWVLRGHRPPKLEGLQGQGKHPGNRPSAVVIGCRAGRTPGNCLLLGKLYVQSQCRDCRVAYTASPFTTHPQLASWG